MVIEHWQILSADGGGVKDIQASEFTFGSAQLSLQHRLGVMQPFQSKWLAVTLLEDAPGLLTQSC